MMEYVYKEPQKTPLGVDHIRDSMACLTNVCTLLKYRRLSLGNTTSSNLHWSVLLSAPLCDGMTKLARLGKSNTRVCRQCMIWIYNQSIYVVFRNDLFDEKYFIQYHDSTWQTLKLSNNFYKKLFLFAPIQNVSFCYGVYYFTKWVEFQDTGLVTHPGSCFDDES